MLKPYLSRLIRQTPLRWHLRNKIHRTELIQRAIDELSAQSYLEIGVADGECFCVVQAPEKRGVDPIVPKSAVALELQRPGVSYFPSTSDAFFEREAPRALVKGVDVVFVDGLHTYEQSYRDVCHALGFLNPGGVIFVHDCLPTSATEARVAPTYDEAWRLNGPDWKGLWTGDGWKAIVAVRSRHSDAEACVLDCDHGVGLIYKAPNRSGLRSTAEEIDALDFEALRRDPRRLIGLRSPAHLLTVLRRLKAERR